jgi:large subunit ribosomal protein L6
MEDTIEIPKGITVKMEKDTISVAGKLGEVKRKLSDPFVDISINDDKILFSSELNTRKQKRIIQTFISEIKSIFKGVTQGVLYKMKVIFVHFPTTVKVEGQKVRIDNFLGERAPRYANVFPGVDIKVTKQDIELRGADLYAVSQSAANIEQACKITKRDRRVFQDGVYITYKDSE